MLIDRTHCFISTSLIIFLVGMIYADASQRFRDFINPIVPSSVDFEIFCLAVNHYSVQRLGNSWRTCFLTLLR